MKEKKKEEETIKEGRWLKPWVQVLLMLLFGDVGARDGREVEKEEERKKEMLGGEGVIQRVLFLGFCTLCWISRRGDWTAWTHASTSTVTVQLLVRRLENLQIRHTRASFFSTCHIQRSHRPKRNILGYGKMLWYAIMKMSESKHVLQTCPSSLLSTKTLQLTNCNSDHRQARRWAHLEGTHEGLVHAHHCPSIVKLSTIVGRWEESDKLSLGKELITVLHHLWETEKEKGLSRRIKPCLEHSLSSPCILQ